MKVKTIGVPREELHAQKFTEEQLQTNKAWLQSRPQAIQELAKKVDSMKVQRIKPGAPYRTTAPGTVGTVLGFTEREDGEPDVIFIAHELHYDETQHSPDELLKVDALDGPLRVNVGVEWLEEDPKP